MFDPVCGAKIEKENLKLEHKKGKFCFCGDDCRREFSDNPEKFTSEPIIRIEDVWKIYTLGKVDVPVLRGLSLRIFRGDFVAIVGPSGSGKTTAMNMVGCLDLPTKGNVFLDGHNISELKESALAEIRGKKIGFIFQQFNLVPSLSAMENILLPLFFQDVERKKAESRAQLLIKSVGLEERSKHKPRELSGGEQQRVAIARALVADPEIILADEPTGNLDSENGKKIMELLVDLWREHKKTLIIITHDPYVASFAKRVISLRDGKMVQNEEYTKRFLDGKKYGG
jgi:putative ABC transport system ATP-binding protein